MTINDTTTVTAAELGALLGLTDRRIRQLAADGLVVKATRGQYLLGESLRAIIIATEGKAEPDDLRHARLELMRSQKRRIDQEVDQREAAVADLDWQDGLIAALTLAAKFRVTALGAWLYAELEHQSCTMDGTHDAPLAIAGQVHEWALGICRELEIEFLGLAAEARRRNLTISDWQTFLNISGRTAQLAELTEETA